MHGMERTLAFGPYGMVWSWDGSMLCSDFWLVMDLVVSRANHEDEDGYEMTRDDCLDL